MGEVHPVNATGEDGLVNGLRQKAVEPNENMAEKSKLEAVRCVMSIYTFLSDGKVAGVLPVTNAAGFRTWTRAHGNAN